jgi:hypothetical protein
MYPFIDFSRVGSNYGLRDRRSSRSGRVWRMPKLGDVRIYDQQGFAIGNLPAGVAQICKLNFGLLPSVCFLEGLGVWARATVAQAANTKWTIYLVSMSTSCQLTLITFP